MARTAAFTRKDMENAKAGCCPRLGTQKRKEGRELTLKSGSCAFGENTQGASEGDGHRTLRAAFRDPLGASDGFRPTLRHGTR